MNHPLRAIVPGAWHLLDGDKLASLVAVFLLEQLRLSGLPGQWTAGVVQTAYANGASTGRN
jgi:phosphoacetylglucosamine mutase